MNGASLLGLIEPQFENSPRWTTAPPGRSFLFGSIRVNPTSVVPAKAGTQTESNAWMHESSVRQCVTVWIPAFAGMTAIRARVGIN